MRGRQPRLLDTGQITYGGSSFSRNRDPDELSEALLVDNPAQSWSQVSYSPDCRSSSMQHHLIFFGIILRFEHDLRAVFVGLLLFGLMLTVLTYLNTLLLESYPVLFSRQTQSILRPLSALRQRAAQGS